MFSPAWQDEAGTLLESELPETSAAAHMLLPTGEHVSGSTGNPGVGSTSGVMSFKVLSLDCSLSIMWLTGSGINSCASTTIATAGPFFKFRISFPAMTPSTTPLQVLPHFVEVLGKKLDKISAEMDRL